MAISLQILPYCPVVPSREQQAFIDSDVRWASYCAGRQGGKTIALAMAVLKNADIPNHSTLVVDPHKRVRSVLLVWVDGCPEVKVNTSRRTITFPSGASIHFVDAVENWLRGMNLDAAAVDDDLLSVHEYTLLLSRLRAPGSTLRATRCVETGKPEVVVEVR